MKVIADLHIHGRFSRATSTNLSIANLEKYARIKGVSLLGTGDFTHPEWLKEIKACLKDDGNGILKTESGFPFLCQTEVSLIYTQDGKGRRVHNVILAPSLEVVEQVTAYLLKRGRVDYDGRPIFKIPCPEFTEDLMGISRDIEIIPAHAWTPWFSVFGSNSGFNSIEECFLDQSKYIHAIETGLSSDPPMNWRISSLDRYKLVSFSDLHSYWPWRIGREATLFDLSELSYKAILRALRSGDGLAGTIECDPSYGKYHWDGHRLCNVVLSPAEALKRRNICPVCRQPLTIGVQHRVEELADRPEGYRPPNARPFHSVVPLSETIAAVTGSPVASKKVWEVYSKLTEGRGEFEVLLDMQAGEIAKLSSPAIAAAVTAAREGKLKIKPGYDGVYGEPQFDGMPVKVDAEKPVAKLKTPQKSIFDFS